MTIVILFLILIFLQLLACMMGAFLAWQKVVVFLTYNIRYESAAYEQAITKSKKTKPTGPPSITTHNGRSIVPAEELVDIEDLDIEMGMSAIEEMGK